MKFELNATVRTLQGSGASRRLRRAAKVPGIIYGGGAEALSIELDHNDTILALRKEAFHSSVVTIKVDGKDETVLLRDAQMHAYKLQVLHVDFQRVDPTQKVHQKVPLHFVNAELSPGVKLGGGTVSHVMNEIDISCLPADLPEFIEVDLKDLQAGHSIHASELKLPKGVTVVQHGGDQTVATIQAKRGGAAAEEAAPAA